MENQRNTIFSNYSGRSKALIILLIACYVAGAAGLLNPLSTPYFQALTPFNLLLSAAILLWFHPDWNRAFVFFCLSSFLLGYLIEVAGVATGLIFGEYAYGPTLGYKIWDVPLIIGLNWLMLIYCTGIVAQDLRIPVVLKAVVASSLMVLLDFFIEPVAITFKFWDWAGSSIPLRNYIAWFLIAFCLHLLFYLLPFQKKNPVAKILYLLQLGFFVILYLFTIY